LCSRDEACRCTVSIGLLLFRTHGLEHLGLGCCTSLGGERGEIGLRHILHREIVLLETSTAKPTLAAQQCPNAHPYTWLRGARGAASRSSGLMAASMAASAAARACTGMGLSRWDSRPPQCSSGCSTEEREDTREDTGPRLQSMWQDTSHGTSPGIDERYASRSSGDISISLLPPVAPRGDAVATAATACQHSVASITETLRAPGQTDMRSHNAAPGSMPCALSNADCCSACRSHARQRKPLQPLQQTTLPPALHTAPWPPYGARALSYSPDAPAPPASEYAR